MQQLHYVGVTPDLKGLVLSARKGSKSGAYTVAVDEVLLAQVEQVVQQRHERNGSAGDDHGPGTYGSHVGIDHGARLGRPESALTPREIQARIRAGYLVAEVAAEAGVDIEWVERFAVPIIAEQQQVLERALAFTYTAARKGKSVLPLGESVAFVSKERGLDLSDEDLERAWSAYQLRDNTWVVRFSYLSRRRPQHADWEVDLRAGTLEALNRQAAEFGYVAKAQRRRREVSEWVVGEQRETLAAADATRSPLRGARVTKQRTAPPTATTAPADGAPAQTEGQATSVATRRVKRARATSAGTNASGTEATPVAAGAASRPEFAGSTSGSLPAGTAASVVGESPGEATTAANRRRRGPSTTAPGKSPTSGGRSPMRKVTSVPPVAKSSRGRPRKAAKKRAASASPRKRTTAARAAAKRTTAKRATAKRATAKRSTAKRSTAKRATAARKSTAKRSTARRTAAKRTTAKRATAKRATAARKSTAKRSTARRSTAKRATAKRATAKRSTAKRATAKRATAKRSTARRTAAKRTTAKRATAKRATAKRATAKRASAARKSTAKRSTARRATAKRSTAKRATAKRSTAKRATAKRATAKRSTAKRAAVKRTAGRRRATRRR